MFIVTQLVWLAILSISISTLYGWGKEVGPGCNCHYLPDDADLKITLFDGLPGPWQKALAPSERPAPGVPVDLLRPPIFERLCLRVVIKVCRKKWTRGPQVSLLNEERASHSYLRGQRTPVFCGDRLGVVAKPRPLLLSSAPAAPAAAAAAAAAGYTATRLHREFPKRKWRRSGVKRCSEPA